MTVSYKDQFGSLAQATASSYGVNPSIFSGLIDKVTGFNPYYSGVSGSGISGLPIGVSASNGSTNPYDPVSGLDSAAKYFATLMDKYGGSYTKSVAAYMGFDPSSQSGIDAANKVIADSINTATGNGSGITELPFGIKIGQHSAFEAQANGEPNTPQTNAFSWKNFFSSSLNTVLFVVGILIVVLSIWKIFGNNKIIERVGK